MRPYHAQSRWRLLLVLLATALIAASCGDDSDEPAAPETTDGTGSTTTASEAPEQNIDTEGTLRMVGLTSALTWDPTQGANAGQQAAMLPYLYDTLVRLGPDNTVVPSLATDFEIAADGLSASVTIRDDVEFWDGTPVDAEAVKANFDRSSVAPSLLQPLLAKLASTTVVSATEVEFTFSTPFYGFFQAMAVDPRLGAIVNPAAFSSPTLLTEGAGSGAYKIARQDGATGVTLERVGAYGDYWDEEAAQYKTLTYTQIPDDTARLNAIKTGAADVMIALNTQLVELEPLAGDDFQLATFPSTSIVQMFVNTKNETLSDPDVRRALSLAIDRSDFVTGAMGGLCEASTSIFAPGVDGSIPDYLGDSVAAADMAEAERLLTSAGVDELNLKMIIPQASTTILGSQILQQQLSEVGINLEIATVQSSQVRADWRAGGYDLMLIGSIASLDPENLMAGQITGGDNIGTPPASVTSLIQAAAAESPGPDRTAGWEAVNEALVEEPLHIPICQSASAQFASSKVLNLENQGYAQLTIIFDARYLALAADE